jgi:hypothetical protein
VRSARAEGKEYKRTSQEHSHYQEQHKKEQNMNVTRAITLTKKLSHYPPDAPVRARDAAAAASKPPPGKVRKEERDKK